MVLRAHEDNVYSFAVVMETKSDTFTVTGKAETLTSSVENTFKVQLPNACLPKNSQLSMKVRIYYKINFILVSVNQERKMLNY